MEWDQAFAAEMRREDGPARPAPRRRLGPDERLAQVRAAGAALQAAIAAEYERITGGTR